MQWFEGNIPEAIAESKIRKVAFVVFVQDQSGDSEKMNATLSDPKVASACSQEACVAVKMNVNSEQCQQFSQIYPLVCVPVIYFIGNTGMPLEVVGGSVSADELISKATAAFEAYKTSTENEAAQSSTQGTGSPVAASTNEEQEPASQETPVAANGPTSNQLSLDDKVQRAKQLMEETRKQKVETEKGDEKNKEVQRRKHGQEILKAKQELDERKSQMIQQKIKDEKAKERAHREEVRQQIARDKAERDAKRLRELQERQNATATPAPEIPFSASSSPTSQAPERSVESKSTNARLQFRFPDGSSVTNTFPADALLEASRQFIASHSLASSYSSGFTLFTTFPRRELTDDDLMKTLRDLDLTPSSTLIVMPKNQGRRSIQGSGGSSVSDLVLWILSPLFALINFIKMFLLGSSSQPRGAYGETSSSNRQSNQPRKDNSTNSSGVRRREGGIHQLRKAEDDDDENNTWNGNSTQQM